MGLVKKFADLDRAAEYVDKMNEERVSCVMCVCALYCVVHVAVVHVAVDAF